MNITFDNSAKTSGKLTLVVEEADYKKDYDKAIKEQCRRANIPGFRPGKAPKAMVERQIGPSVLVDTMNKLVGQKLYEYIQTEKIDMLGEPMPSDSQEQIDLEKPAPYTFVFDIALAPELNVTFDGRTKIPYYTIKVTDELVDQQVQMYASRTGSYEKVEEYQDNDMLKGDLRQLDAEGNTMEEGINLTESIIMPKYIKNADEQKKFENIKLGDVITFNPRKAYENDAELAALLKVSKDQAVMYEELFEQAFPGAEIKDEAAFRARIAEDLKGQLEQNSEFRFLADLREAAVKKAGDVQYDDELMKKIMLANNKDKGQEYVDKNYEASIKELTWHLLKNKLAEAQEIKIEDADVKSAAKEMAKMQFAQYGMSNVPEEYLDNYVQEMMKKRENIDSLVERALDVKLVAAFKGIVKLDEKEVTIDEFNKLAEA